MDKLRGEIRKRDESIDDKQKEIRSWAEEADRLRREIDELKRKLFDTTAAHEQLLKDERLSKHQLQSQLAASEVEKVGGVCERKGKRKREWEGVLLEFDRKKFIIPPPLFSSLLLMSLSPPLFN